MANGNETTTKFRVDISELKKGIQDANRQIKLANAQFKSASAGMDDWSKSADGLQAKIAQIEKVLKAQKSILSSYEKQLALIETEYGKNSKEADEMRIKVENQRAAVIKTEKSLNEYSVQLSDLENGQDKAAASADDLGKSVKKAGDDADKASGGFSVFKGVLADLVATGIKAAVNGLKDLAKAAKDSFAEFDTGRDAIIKLTGATGKNAEALMQSYSEVAKTVNADMTTIGSAIGEVNTRFGVSGERLETLSSYFVKFAKINDTDVVGSIDDVQKAMSAYGLSSDKAEGFLDRLTKTAQETGVQTGSLTKGIISNATAFQELGLNVDQAVSLMGQLEKSGSNSETVLNGMRKALKSATKEGKPLGTVLADLESKINSNAKGVNGLQAAYDVFGKSGDQIYGAIKNGSLSFKDLTAAAESAAGSVENTFEGTQDAADKVKLAIQGMKISFGQTVDSVLTKYAPDIENAIAGITPVVESLVNWLAERVPPVIETVKNAFDTIAPVVTDVFETVAPIIHEAFDEVAEIVKSVFGWIIDNKDLVIGALVGIGAAIVAWNIASVVTSVLSFVKAVQAMGVAASFAAAKQWLLNAALAANPIGLIVAAIAGLVAAFVVLWKKSDKFRQFWIGLWDGIKNAVSAVVNWISGVFNGIIDFFKNNWKTILLFIVNPFAGAFKLIYNKCEGFRNFVDKIVGAVKGFFVNLGEKVKAVFTALVNFIISVFSPVVDFFRTAFNIIFELAQGCWNLIQAVWSAVSTWFNEKIIQPIAGFFAGLWDGIKNAAKAAWDFISGIWKAVSGWMKNTVIVPVQNFFKGMWDGLKNGAKAAWDGIKSVFGGIADWFKDKFSKAWQAVKNVFSAGGKIFTGIKEGIVSAFKAVVNAIIKGINAVISVPFNAINGILEKIKNVSILGLKPFENLIHRFDVPQIPLLKRGGVLKRGQVGLLEGDGAEAVVPLENNKRWIAATAAELKKALRAEGSIGAPAEAAAPVTNITNNFNQTNNSPKALSRLEIYRQSKNLFAMKGAT